MHAHCIAAELQQSQKRERELRELFDRIRAIYHKHVHALHLGDMLDGATLEGEVWVALHPNTEAPKEAEGSVTRDNE